MKNEDELKAFAEKCNSIIEAVKLMLEIDKVNQERDLEIMDTYADIPNNLRKFNDLCRVFNKFEEFDGGLPTSEEFEKLLAKALGHDTKKG
jgi:hypothetical protein